MGGPYDIVERWAETFNEGEPSAVAALYALGATIWGTLAQSLTTSPDDSETYFIQAARAGLGPGATAAGPGRSMAPSSIAISRT